MNKKTFIIPLLIMLIIASCGPPQNNQARLARLEAQREALDARIEKLVSRLRAKLERNPSNPQYLITVRGRGYKLVNP